MDVTLDGHATILLTEMLRDDPNTSHEGDLYNRLITLTMPEVIFQHGILLVSTDLNS